MLLNKAAAVCGACAVALAGLTPLIAATARPGYRHCSQYISELGEVGAPHAAWANFAGFLPTGVFAILFVVLAALHPSAKRARFGLLLFSAVGGAYVVAAFFPCDPGCPVSGSSSQSVHNAFGFLEYLGGGLGLVLVGRTGLTAAPQLGARLFSMGCAVVVFTAFVAMLLPQLTPVRGCLQRAAETALFLWILAASWRLWTDTT